MPRRTALDSGNGSGACRLCRQDRAPRWSSRLCRQRHRAAWPAKSDEKTVYRMCVLRIVPCVDAIFMFRLRASPSRNEKQI